MSEDAALRAGGREDRGLPVPEVRLGRYRRGRGVRPRVVLALAAVTALLTGCREAPARSHPEITVAAAADLMDALPELATTFQRETGVHVVMNFGASGQLAQQVAEGAPIDVFMSADMHYVEELGDAGLLVRGTRAIFGVGKLVLWSPRGGPRVDSVGDLLRPDVRRVAMANPETAPYGHAAEEALRMSGLWNAVKRKTVYGENVRQAMLYARSGDADVAFVPASLTGKAGGRAVPVPEELYPRMYQMLAVVRDTRAEPAARTFVAFVTGPQGLAILARHGFEPPPEQH